MANEAMKENWATGGERWAANERIIDSVFTSVTEAILARGRPRGSESGARRRLRDRRVARGERRRWCRCGRRRHLAVDGRGSGSPGARCDRRRRRRPDRRPARRRAGRRVRPGAVAVRRDVLRRPRRRVRQHPCGGRARAPTGVRLLAIRGDRRVHVGPRPARRPDEHAARPARRWAPPARSDSAPAN